MAREESRKDVNRNLVLEGNVLDLWAAIHKLPLYEAALHLAETFQLPRNETEKRNP